VGGAKKESKKSHLLCGIIGLQNWTENVPKYPRLWQSSGTVEQYCISLFYQREYTYYSPNQYAFSRKIDNILKNNSIISNPIPVSVPTMLLRFTFMNEILLYKDKNTYKWTYKNINKKTQFSYKG